MEKTITKPRIREKAYMVFPHQGEILTAMHPFYGPTNSRTLQNLIRKDRCKEPTSAQLTSFVHEYFNGDEPQAKEVNQIMEINRFRGFTGILYLPQKQIAHFIDYPKFDEENFVDRDDLLKRLGESRAQVPFKYLKEGSVDWRKVAKHPYFIAWAGGKEGAEKLAKLASEHPSQKAYIGGVPEISNLKEPIARIGGLDSCSDNRLGIAGNHYGHGSGYAFGVLK